MQRKIYQNAASGDKEIKYILKILLSTVVMNAQQKITKYSRHL